jgi:hypothetical protein
MKMKNLLMTTIAIFGLAIFSNAQVPNYIPTNGLVGWWPFNGNANDESININDGTVNGASLTTDRFGNINSAFEFDGQSNYISVNDNSVLKFSSHTLSIWYYRSENPLIQTGICANNGNEMLISKGRDIENNSFTIAQLIDSGQIYQIFPTQVITNYSLGSWNNIICAYDSISNTAKVYDNGILISTFDSVIWNCFSNISDLTFGVHSAFLSTSCSFFYKGKIDDIGIWNRALNLEEITSLYFGSSVGINEVSQSNMFTVFPNPAQSEVNVKLDAKLLGSVFTIYDNLGKAVKTGKINSENITIEINDLSVGIYTFSVGENKKQTFKVIKE